MDEWTRRWASRLTALFFLAAFLFVWWWVAK